MAHGGYCSGDASACASTSEPSCSTLVSRLDAYSAKHFLGPTALGYYSLALALADLVTVSTDAVAAALAAV